MRGLIIFLLSATIALSTQGQQVRRVSGSIVSANVGEPLPGASVKLKGTNAGTTTDDKGMFSLFIPVGDQVLIASSLGFQTKEVVVSNSLEGFLTIVLREDAAQLDEVVVSTGYYDIPKERATGSFTHIDNELLTRSVGSDVIGRLEGVTSSLLFDRRGQGVVASSSALQLRVRGLSTIYANEAPLIVVDGFPYDGDLQNINPNDVESITLLKDAAAASIWGARAGNGVIVIKTKKGRLNQSPTISFNSNVTLQDKVDLFYNPGFLSSEAFIETEQLLFERGFYNADINSLGYPVLSPVVELLAKERDGLISGEDVNEQLSAWKQQDVRWDAEKYLYRNGIQQQYALNIRGGTSYLQYYLSGGYDNSMASGRGDRQERITLTATNTFRPSKNLEMIASIAYVKGKAENNSLELHEVKPSSRRNIYPYAQLADENGSALAIVKDYSTQFIEEQTEGSMNWQYRPLEEQRLNNNIAKNIEVRIKTGIRYSLLDGLDAEAKYFFQRSVRRIRSLQDASSYEVRKLVNQFTQTDGSTIFPPGGILYNSQEEYAAHSGRLQLNYNKQINKLHHLSAVAGTEIRQAKTEGNAFELYGYDDAVLTFQRQLDFETRYPVRPRGSLRLPLPSTSLTSLLDRFVSYYVNAAYTYGRRYTLSASARKDASNLFGVNTNQKAVPLWSAGVSWHLSEELFYHLEAVPYLKLRATYGYNGNLDRSLTAFTTASYRTDPITGLQFAQIRSPGNPELRWEKVAIWNIGLDFETQSGRIRGTLEYFTKDGKDLIGDIPLDPTTGFLDRYKLNYAGLRTKGIDIELTTLNIDKEFTWRTDLLLSYAKDKVTRYELENKQVNTFFNTLDNVIRVGKSLHGTYSYPWAGLDPATGDPLVSVEGEAIKDYSTFIRETSPEDLIYHGVSLPPYFGSVRNTFSWKGFELSFNLTWKTGYYFRRSSINYSDLFDDWRGHRDFISRWRQPGDETITQVPSIPEMRDSNRDLVYLRSELLVEKGDHIRLQDVNLSYAFNPRYISRTPLKQLRLFVYSRNLGILWQSSKVDLDPDYPNARYGPAAAISFGINASF